MAAGFDPTVINGGIINAYGTNARLGAGEWMVVEADECDGTFLKLPADIAIVTNIDPEHLDHFKNFEAVQKAFRAFVENVPFYGFSVMCIDHPVVQNLVGRIEDRRVITYGENPQADVRLLDIACGRHARCSRSGPRPHRADGARDHEIALPMPGRHNALNATAAIAVAHELGVDETRISEALAQFGGVRRRFTRTGMERRHHHRRLRPPSGRDRRRAQGRAQIDQGPGDRCGPAASLYAAAALFEQFCTCFNDADAVIVAHVYPAGESPIEGADRDSLVQGLRTHGHRNVVRSTVLNGSPPWSPA